MSHRLWDSHLYEFAPDHRTIAVDLRGHGQSDKPYREYSPPEMAADLVTHINELDLQEVTYAGWSIATPIGGYLNEYCGDALSQLVVFSSGTFHEMANDCEESDIDIESLISGLLEDHSGTMNRYIDRMFKTDVSESLERWMWNVGMDVPLCVAVNLLRNFADIDYGRLKTLYEPQCRFFMAPTTAPRRSRTHGRLHGTSSRTGSSFSSSIAVTRHICRKRSDSTTHSGRSSSKHPVALSIVFNRSGLTNSPAQNV